MSDRLASTGIRECLAEGLVVRVLPPHARRFLHREGLPLLTITAACVLVYARTLFLGYVLTLDDTGRQIVPWMKFMADHRAQGNWFAWCPDVGCGFPFWANAQSGAFYPLNLLMHLPTEPHWTLTVLLLIHHLLAATGMYLLARTFGLGRLASVVAGLEFTFAGFLATRELHYHVLSAAAWVPWIAMGLIRWTRNGAWGGFVLAALAVCWQTMHPHVLVLGSVVALAAVAAYVVQRVPAEQRLATLARRLALATLPLATGALLGGPGYWPLVMLTRAGLGQHRFGYDFMVSFGTDPASLFGLLLFPNLVPREPTYAWEVTGYMGAAALCIAFTVVARGAGRRRLQVAFIILALLSLALALGKYTPLYGLLQYIPPFHRFRCPGRWLLLWSLCVSMLAGLAVNELRQGKELRLGRLASWTPLLATVPAVACLGLWAASADGVTGFSRSPEATPPGLPGFTDLLVATLSMVALAAILVLAARGCTGRTWTARLVALLVVAQAAGFMWTHTYLVREDRPEWPHWPPEVVEATARPIVQGGRLGTWAPTVVKVGYLPNSNMLKGVPMLEVYDPLEPPVMVLRKQIGERLVNPRVSAALGVGILLSEVDPSRMPAGWQIVKKVPISGRETWLYRNEHFRGLAWTVARSTPAPTAAQILADSKADAGFLLDAPTIEPAWTAPHATRPDATRREVHVEEWGARQIRMDVRAGPPAFLVITSARLPAWKATVNGRPAILREVNSVFQGLDLGPEASDVVLEYVPAGLETGLFMTLAGVCLGALCLSYRRLTLPRNRAR